MKASILLAVHDEPRRLLEACVDSLLRQTYRDFELVVMDDGSTNPETKAVLDSLRDPRVRVFRGPHRGHGPTLNSGIENCRGEYIVRSDADDWSEPGRIAKQVGFLDARPGVGLVGSHVQLHQESGRPLWVDAYPADFESIRNSFANVSPFCHGATCFRRELALKVGGYPDQVLAEDYVFFRKLCGVSEAANIPEVLYHMVLRRGSVTTTMIDPILRGDYLMMAGAYGAAFGSYLERAYRPKAWLKIVRLALFMTVPPLRKRMIFKRYA